MKKNYIAPVIKVKVVDADPMMAANSFNLSPVDGDPQKDADGGISIGAKKGLFDGSDESNSGSSIWENE